MRCKLCRKPQPALIRVRVYTAKGIYVCGECRDLVYASQKHPYSAVADRMALAETGGYANRKRARF